jgi:hypothetical protein
MPEKEPSRIDIVITLHQGVMSMSRAIGEAGCSKAYRLALQCANELLNEAIDLQKDVP